ncbi:MAG: hypothetical protein QOI64_1050 [Solirubrobacteraceae bacterium]|nr:hypothetical protein [Solirubrobacteraceae bacterium]
MLPRNAGSWYARDRGCAPGKQTGRSIVNIRELDEESRRTGVWPPRRIILRVEDAEEAAADGRAAPVKVGEVDLAAPRPAAAPKPAAVPAPLPATSMSPSVTPSRRPGLRGAGGVTPAPAASPEDAAFEAWLAKPLARTDSEPEYQAPPAWLPDDVRVRADRRHRRVARKARTQLFGASAATTLAIGGFAAALGIFGLSQTESVGGSLGAPSIGLFGTRPEAPPSNEPAEPATAKPAPKKSAKAQRNRPARATRSNRRRSAGAGASRSARASTPARSSNTATSRAPAQPVANSPAPVQRRASNPPPPSPPPSPPPAPAASTPSPPVVWDAPSAPSRPTNIAPSRPAPSAPSTTSSPAP